MSTRGAAWLAWSLWALCVALFVLVVLIPTRGEKSLAVILPFGMFVAGFATAGALIASQRPENPIGWIMCSIAPLFELGAVAEQYAEYALLMRPGSLPGGLAMAWLSSWIWGPGLGLFTFLLLLFPDGRLPSRRWRPVVWFSMTLLALAAVSVAFSPGEIDNLRPVKNPLGIERAAGVLNLPARVFFWLLGTPLLVSTVSLLLRLGRARGDERQQIKWFTYAAALLVGDVGALSVFGAGIDSWLGFALFAVGLLAVPASIGVAILKYRLYDIDLIINRTLVYGSLTATLVALYFGGIVMLQRFFVALTGEKSTLAVVASTLVIAALFAPLRRRIQDFIDRRFYRRKYDATKTLEAFTAKLRDETDLDALNAELVSVVRETMQPAHVSLWLRPDPPLRESEGQE